MSAFWFHALCCPSPQPARRLQTRQQGRAAGYHFILSRRTEYCPRSLRVFSVDYAQLALQMDNGGILVRCLSPLLLATLVEFGGDSEEMPREPGSRLGPAINYGCEKLNKDRT